MKLFVATDINIALCEGRIYARGKYSTILKRYHDAFGPIVLCARFQEIETATAEYEDITSIVVDTVKVPSLLKALTGGCKPAMKAAMQDCDLVVVRCPAIAAYKAADCARELGKPYFAESMGCAWDAYWNHGLVGKAIAPYMFFKMKSVVSNANYALYVTSRFLQGRYPCKNKSVAASNVLIGEVEEDVLTQRLDKLRRMSGNAVTLMTTAAVNVRYKGQHYVIRAIPALNRAGIRVKYLVVGEGDQTYLRQVAAECGVADQVVFMGVQPLSEVFRLLDEADIYIQPSLQEGLPRSVIEAMSRGCPCIGARTAGIPELLEDRFVVRRKSVEDIAKTVRDFCDSTEEERVAVAERNFREAKQFLKTELDARRDAYYGKVIKELCGGDHAE